MEDRIKGSPPGQWLLCRLFGLKTGADKMKCVLIPAMFLPLLPKTGVAVSSKTIKPAAGRRAPPAKAKRPSVAGLDVEKNCPRVGKNGG